MKKSILKNFRILIADQDREMGEILSQMLQNLGFSTPYLTRSGQEALRALTKKQYDFVITEWNTEQIDGLEIIRKIRKEGVITQPTLPVIMLTGRAEHSDVIAARDAGVNEYVVKPFSVKSIYNRLERIIEQPRNFVISHQFIGPDRRHRVQPDATHERRIHKLQPTPGKPISPILSVHDAPLLWQADFGLKTKLGTGNTLQSLITPEILNQAQNAINAINQESLEWIKNDFQELRLLAKELGHAQSKASKDAISDLSLRISSRAGTFGYEYITRIAYMLYLFCRNDLQLHSPNHATIVQKHIEVLYVLMSQRLLGEKEDFTLEVVNELKNLTEKLR